MTILITVGRIRKHPDPLRGRLIDRREGFTKAILDDLSLIVLDIFSPFDVSLILVEIIS